MSEHDDAEAKRIGRLIARLRLKQGWNQQDLAHELGIHASTVSRWERGKHEGYAANWRKLAKVLQVEPALLRPAEPEIETKLDRIEDRLEQIHEAVTALLGADVLVVAATPDIEQVRQRLAADGRS